MGMRVHRAAPSSNCSQGARNVHTSVSSRAVSTHRAARSFHSPETPRVTKASPVTSRAYASCSANRAMRGRRNSHRLPAHSSTPSERAMVSVLEANMVSAATKGSTASQAPSAVSSTTAQGRSCSSGCKALSPRARDVHHPWATPRSSAGASAWCGSEAAAALAGCSLSSWLPPEPEPEPEAEAEAEAEAGSGRAAPARRWRFMIQATAPARASMATIPSSARLN